MWRMHFGMPDTNLISLQPSDDDDVYEGVTVDDVLLIVQLRCISRSQPTSQTGGR